MLQVPVRPQALYDDPLLADLPMPPPLQGVPADPKWAMIPIATLQQLLLRPQSPRVSVASRRSPSGVPTRELQAVTANGEGGSVGQGVYSGQRVRVSSPKNTPIFLQQRS